MPSTRPAVVPRENPALPDSEMPLLSIQEVARRTGVAKITLRAWERRYGVPRPEKTPKGYRLYSERHIREIASIVRLGASGIATRQAAFLVARRRALSDEPGAPTKVLRNWRTRLEAACLRFDDATAQQLLQEAELLLSHFDVLQKVVLPVVATFGDGREAGVISISQEHFASVLARNVVARSQHDAAARRPLVLTGCAPGEQHELGILAVVCGLREAGYRVVHLGANVPALSLLATADQLKARTIVVAVTLRRNLRPWINRAADVRRRQKRGVSFVWAGPGAAGLGGLLPGGVGLSIEQAIDHVRAAQAA